LESAFGGVVVVDGSASTVSNAVFAVSFLSISGDIPTMTVVPVASATGVSVAITVHGGSVANLVKVDLDISNAGAAAFTIDFNGSPMGSVDGAAASLSADVVAAFASNSVTTIVKVVDTSATVRTVYIAVQGFYPNAAIAVHPATPASWNALAATIVRPFAFSHASYVATEGRSYRFYTRAANAEGWSATSPVASVIAAAVASAPNAPLL
jgi:hypothetical protein